MRAEGKAVSIAQLCRWFGVPRSTFYYRPMTTGPRPAVLDSALVATIRTIIEAEPAAGLRMITARVRRELAGAGQPQEGASDSEGERLAGAATAAAASVRACRAGSRGPTRPNERWAIDTTHLFCGRDGWCHLTAIIDCCDRTIVGWRLSRSGIAHVAAAALEDALRERRITQGHEPLDAAVRQRPRVRREGLRLGRAPLRARARVHHALQSGAERDDRTLLPDLEAGVRLAAAVRGPRSRLPRRRRLARSLSHRAAALGARLPHAEGVPGAN